MNKPATKEPSMDEILSSIRQIIADDDASAAPAPRPVSPPAFAPMASSPAPIAAAAPVRPAPAAPPRPASEPLALSAAQIVPSAARPASPVPAPAPAPIPAAMDFSAVMAGLDDPEPEVTAGMEEMLAGEPQLIDPEDVAFEPEPEPEPEPVPEPPVMRAPEPPRRAPEPRPAPRPAASVAQAAPMPDSMLSADIAEQLLAPATDAAVQGAMSRLGALHDSGIGGMTVEAMIREMLKPMLKDWLDENLPALVESLVEKEIARITRGVK